MARFVLHGPLAAVLAVLSVTATGCSTTGDQARNTLGYGYEVTPVSNLIYRIDVKAGITGKPEEIRAVALSQACKLAASKGFARYQIVGGDGFRKVTKNVQAGPLPLPLLRVPEGSIVIRLVDGNAPLDADTVDVSGGCATGKPNALGES